MPSCGRCGGGLTPNVDGYACGSTGNPDNPGEILWYHNTCPNRKPEGRCEAGGHLKYPGTCACAEPISCEHCEHCKKCEQHELFRNTPSIRKGFHAVSRIIGEASRFPVLE